MISLGMELEHTMDAVTATRTDRRDEVPPADGSDLAGRLRFGVTRLARLLRQQSDAGLSPTQLATLATIERIGPLPIGALADAEQVGAPTATKVVDKLHAAGYVERVPDAEDRRIKRVAVSPAGRQFLAELRARKTAWLTTRLGELSPDDRATLAAALPVIEQLIAAPDRATGRPPDH
jgi:DNA-binding MarR family transcriptional regulator